MCLNLNYIICFVDHRKGEHLQEPDQAEGDKFREPFFNFYDARLMDGAWKQQPDPKRVEMFFRLLAVCHTVIPSGPQVCCLCECVFL